MAGTILLLLGASIIFCAWVTLGVKPGSQLHQLLQRIVTILGRLKESITDFVSMKELKRVRVPLGGGLLYFAYNQYQKSGLRLFVGFRDVEGTRFQELKIESAIRLREFLDPMNETGEIDVPFANGNLMRLRRDDNLYPWLKAGENVASQGKHLPLFINLEGSGDSMFVEVPLAAAALIVNALDGFFSLAGVRQKY